MYRIELAPGEEALFKSLEELAVGVQSGVVTPHARIWHAASNKWLPIDFHPHYKLAKEKPVVMAKAPAAVSAPAAAAAPVPTPAAAVKPIFAAAESAPPSPAVAPAVVASPAIEAEPAAVGGAAPHVASHALVFLDIPGGASAPQVLHPDYAGEAEPVHLDFGHAPDDEAPLAVAASPLSSRRRMILAAAAAALVVGAGAAYAFSGSGSAAATPREFAVSSEQLAAQPPAPTLESVAAENAASQLVGRTAVDSAPRKRATVDSAAVIPIAPAFSLPNAAVALTFPETSSGRPAVVTPATLAANYNAAHDAARADLDNRLRVAGIVNLFAASRLGSGNIGSARLALAGAAGLVRSFQKRGAAIEQAYRDSAQMLGKLGWTAAQRANWESRADRGERSTQASDGLLSDIEGMFGVLAANEGGYDVTNGTITFRDADGAREYGAFRQRIASRIEGGDAGSASVASLLRAIGGTRLPTEKVGD